MRFIPGVLLRRPRRNAGTPRLIWRCFFVAAALSASHCSDAPPPPSASKPKPALTAPTPKTTAVMLGIDVLEADGFAAIRGKRIGLLTHPAGVNGRGESTIDVLRRAPDTKLVALFAPEHGLYGTEKAAVKFGDTRDARTGLPVYSLHGDNRRPTPAQLKGVDALVIDLQDIGVRAYTFSVVMRYAMDSCFQYGVEVIVLDRPNPLGGLKVDGPLLDSSLRSGVGAYPIPYVHGLTMGELARYAAGTPGVIDVPELQRIAGRLTVIPMRGWRRSMRWPDTGLTFFPTSHYIRDFDAVMGFAMVGLGCEYSGFRHGLGTPYPFRLLRFDKVNPATLEKDLNQLNLSGLAFQTISTRDGAGKPVVGVRVDVTDWDTWNPTELSFQLMRLACRYDPPNPFAKLNGTDTDLYNKHVGSLSWWSALRRDGAGVSLEVWRSRWAEDARAFQKQSQKFWLYQ